MMTAEQLKASILQMAMQGKLVEQKKKDSGEKYFDRIALETQNAIVLKEIGKPRKISSDIVESLEFDVPETWKKGNLQDICSLSDGVKVVGVCLPNLDAKYLRGKSDPVYKNSGKLIRQGERAILVDGENSGEVFIIPEDGMMGSTFKKLFINPIMEARFVLYVLEYYRPYFRNNKKGSAIPHLDKDLFASAPIGIPPIEEQKRIVAKIEELMPFVEQYAKASTRLNTLNASFPDQIKKSILQQAVMGKLVPQDPSDEPASVLLKKIAEEKQKLIKEGKIKKQKALPTITEDEIPFDIPESWEWARLDDLTRLITKGSSPKWQGINYVEEGLLFVTSENVGVNTLIWDNKKYVEEQFNDLSPRSVLKKGDILTNIVGASIGRTAVYDLTEPANINQAVCIIRLVDTDLLSYIQFYMNSPTAYKIMMSDKVDTARANISLTNIANFLIPLPPIAEQRRIIKKLDKISLYTSLVYDSVNKP